MRAITLTESLDRHTSKTPDCWEWTGHKTGKGYGWLCNKRKTYFAHRVAWEVAYGAIPDGLSVLHRCDNRCCVRPDHLFLGTQQDNVADMVAKGRDPVGEQITWKAKLTSPQVMEIRALRAQGVAGKLIAERFGVHISSVYHIAAGRVWKHVPSFAQKKVSNG